MRQLPNDLLEQIRKMEEQQAQLQARQALAQAEALLDALTTKTGATRPLSALEPTVDKRRIVLAKMQVQIQNEIMEHLMEMHQAQQSNRKSF